MAETKLSSTAEIMVSLYKKSSEFKNIDISKDDPFLAQCAAIDARTMQAIELIKPTTEMSHLQDEIKHTIDLLAKGDKTRPAASAEAPTARNNYETVKMSAEELHERKEELKKRAVQMVSEKSQKIADYIQTKSQKNIPSDDNRFKQLEKSLKQEERVLLGPIRKEIDKLRKDTGKYDLDLAKTERQLHKVLQLSSARLEKKPQAMAVQSAPSSKENPR